MADKIKPGEKPKSFLKKAWHFVWESDSVWSWIVDVVLCYVLIRFVVYPVLGLLLVTSHPIVAVVSGSMEHRITDENGVLRMCGNSYSEKSSVDFGYYWQECGKWYESVGVTKTDFYAYSFRNGFNKGDIMVLKGIEPGNVKRGDVIVFMGSMADPIIHRVIKVDFRDGRYYFTTKGDHNSDYGWDDREIAENKVIGRAVLRIPYMGYIKIGFIELLKSVGLVEGY